MAAPLDRDAILNALRTVHDPDLRKDIVTLGFVKDLAVDGDAVAFTIELTTPACPVKGEGSITPDEWRELLAYVHTHRTSTEPFDAVHSGATPGNDLTHAAALVEPYARAGVTWWIEPVDPWRFGWSFEVPWPAEATVLIRERIAQGPPRL